MDVRPSAQHLCPRCSTRVRRAHYPGIGRVALVVSWLGLMLVEGILLHPVFHVIPDGLKPIALLSAFLIPLPFRLRNMGASPLWCLLVFVPIANIVLIFRCVVCPQGYAETRELDRAGRISISLITLLCAAIPTFILMYHFHGTGTFWRHSGLFQGSNIALIALRVTLLYVPLLAVLGTIFAFARTRRQTPNPP